MLENAAYFLAISIAHKQRLTKLNFDRLSQIMQRLDSTTPFLTLELMLKDFYIVKWTFGINLNFELLKGPVHPFVQLSKLI